jgi:hypothetical protein
MLLKFFTNSQATAYLRGMAEEFGESTNSIRHELNNLSKAGYLVSFEDGRTISYRANTEHALYPEVKNLVHKYLGIDKIVDNIISRLGNLKAAFIVGDYAVGKDSGTIELVLIGEVDESYLLTLVEKAHKLIQRKVNVRVIQNSEYELRVHEFKNALLLWHAM